MRKLTLAIAALFALGIRAPAAAADLPVRAPVYKGPPPIIFSWTGLYIGVHGGADWFDKDWFVPLTPTNMAGNCVVDGCPKPAGSHTSQSWLAGGQIGFNYQVSWAVFGVEAQASWTKLEGSNVSTFVAVLTNHSKTDAIGTIAGRLGVAWDRSLLYVKGGGAWAHDEFWTTSGICNTTVCHSVTDTRWGWMVGVGWEYAFANNWSAKIEYDHLDFNRRRETLLAVCAACLPFEYDIKQTVDLIKVGINYRFGGPVVARY